MNNKYLHRPKERHQISPLGHYSPFLQVRVLRDPECPDSTKRLLSVTVIPLFIIVENGPICVST